MTNAYSDVVYIYSKFIQNVIYCKAPEHSSLPKQDSYEVVVSLIKISNITINLSILVVPAGFKLNVICVHVGRVETGVHK